MESSSRSAIRMRPRPRPGSSPVLCQLCDGKKELALAAASAHPWQAMAVAWVPWALIRVASFVALGVVLSGPVLGRIFRFEYRLGDQRRWLTAALIGLVLDVVLKWAWAPMWRELIRNAAGWR